MPPYLLAVDDGEVRRLQHQDMVFGPVTDALFDRLPSAKDGIASMRGAGPTGDDGPAGCCRAEE